MKTLRIPTLVLAAFLQLVPICRTVCTSPAANSAFAIIFRWAVGATALIGFDAVSSASTAVAIDSPSTATGAVGSPFLFFITLSGGVKNDPGSLVIAVPLPDGLTNYTVDGSSQTPPDVYGVIAGTPTTAVNNFIVNLAASNPNYTTNSGPPILSTLSLTILPSATPVILSNQPVSVTIPLGSNVNFSITAGGTPPLTYQWFRGNTNISNRIVGATNSAYTLINAQITNNADNYIVRVVGPGGNVTSSNAVLTVNGPPAITADLAGATNNAGTKVTFKVLCAGPALTYHWFYNTNTPQLSTSNSLVFSKVQFTNSGIYAVVITNNFGSITSSFVPLVVNSAPLVSVTPTNLTASVGNSAVFTATAAGNAPLAYQWRKNLTNNISGATNAAYSIANVQTNDGGSFTVVVTNAFGSITSSPPATLTVNFATAPAITVPPPASLSVIAGQPAAFTVTATGTAPLAYQWINGVTPVAGATDTNYTIATAHLFDAGNYAVIVTNVAGSVTSSVSTLTVNAPTAPVTQAAQSGGLFYFTFTPVVGLTNSVLTNDGIALPNWNVLTNIPPPASASSVTVTDVISDAGRFYRVQIIP